MAKLRPSESSSSINSDEIENFGQSLEKYAKIANVHESESSQLDRNSDFEAMKLLNNTPGVGTYNIEGKK